MISRFSYWSIFHGTRVTRFACLGTDGEERHIFVNDDLPGKERRRLKEEALEALGRVDFYPPGEIAL